MIIAGTGHRPKDIPAGWDWIRSETRRQLESKQPDFVMSGMAEGFDIVLAEIAIDLGIPTIAAIPYKEHYDEGMKKDRYAAIVRKSELVFVNNPGYAVWKLHKRNEYMVDNSDLILACWNGKQSGGTFACINYAKKQNRGIIRLDPANKTVGSIG